MRVEMMIMLILMDAMAALVAAFMATVTHTIQIALIYFVYGW